MNQNKILNTPELRFPEFTKGWTSVSAADSFVSRRERGQSGLPIYSVTLDRGLIRRSELARQPANNAADEDNLRAHPNDIVYNMMRMWQGAVGVAKEECMVSPAYVVMEPKVDIDPLFYNYWMKRERSIYLLWAYSQGLTNDRLRLYPDDFYSIPHFRPEHQEQLKISEFLKLIDSKINALNQRNTLLRRYKKGCMQKIFSQKIRLKDSKGKNYPNWKMTPLSEVFLERSERGNPDWELLSVTLRKGVVRAKDVDRATSASIDRSNYKAVMVDDIAYNSMRMWQGASGHSQFKGIVSPAYTVISPKKGHISKFWAQYFKLNRVIHVFERHSQGLTSDTWNLKYPTFSGIKLSAPSQDEQIRIVEFLSNLDEKIDLATTELYYTKMFKDGLLQKLFI